MSKTGKGGRPGLEPGTVIGVYKVLGLSGRVEQKGRGAGVYMVECLNCNKLSERIATTMRKDSHYCEHCTPYKNRYYKTTRQKSEELAKQLEAMAKEQAEEREALKFITQPCPPSVLEKMREKGIKSL